MKDNSSRKNEYDFIKLFNKTSYSNKLQLIFLIYAVLGCIIGVLSLIYFLMLKLEIDLTQQERIILIVSGSGFSLSFISIMFLVAKRIRKSVLDKITENIMYSEMFLYQWSTFESLGRLHLESKGREFNEVSIRSIISGLFDEGFISKEDVFFLDECLRFRNDLVHGRQQFESNMLSPTIDFLKKINKRLENY